MFVLVARENLEKQRVVSEEERKRLVGLVAQLEQKLAEQSQITEEEKWNLRQEATRLDAATKAFEKERDRALQQIDREKQQLQVVELQIPSHLKHPSLLVTIMIRTKLYFSKFISEKDLN